MIWMLLAVIAAAWTARRILAGGPFTTANLGLAFALGVAAGSAVALVFGLIGLSMLDGGLAGEEVLMAILRRGPMVAALGALAGIAHGWVRARRRAGGA